MSVLLLGADYYGTLAAARCYGRNGVPVTMADENPRARALFSRYVGVRDHHPALSDPEKLITWLLTWGERNKGALLYPPNDHLAWLFAAERERLGRVFTMYSPSEETVIRLLDKKRLHDACGEVGIDVPVTHMLGDAGVASPVVDTLRYPVLLKPRTQVFLRSGIKGFIAHDKKELESELARFKQLVRFDDVLTSRHPEIIEPMVQEYLTAAETNIISVSGFVTTEGRLVARCATKVLQRPRKVGIGLCFEGRPVDEKLSQKLAELCKHVGYHGAFEAEFIVDGDKRLLIDFNPRFYSQMGFDIARGLPLPMLVLHAARGDEGRLEKAMSDAETWQPTGLEAYCHETMLDLVLRLQGLSGRMPKDEVAYWRSWLTSHRGTVTDAVRDPEDGKPALVDTAQWAMSFARYPRSFVRSFVLNR